MEMEKLKFVRPKCVGGQSVPTPHLYVANCGPALGLSLETIATAFGIFGTVASVNTADETGTRVIVTYHGIAPAEAAKESWDGYPCSYFGGRVLHLQYSVPCAPCKTRNVDREQNLGQLPLFLSDLLNRISSLPEVNQAENYLPLDQLTVNEYPPGVGLSPHIDTHSAFDGCIISLSLAGPCIMEFRKYTSVGWVSSKENDADHGQLDVDMSCTEDNLGNQCSTKCPKFERMALFLPPRSLLLLSEDARYAWHHYIPHHKVDIVNGERIPRSLRRVSFTFRKVRFGPCSCRFPQYCDSQIQVRQV
ncbi:alkylated DNA repair protein ALKBH8 homolog isoform X4 [Cryptomeria japonica]|uniref:alkylated DNA repair protein ALKBH8 homolog isoform X4 n=1 Tax=Cryptomeria japonica TaxID=3369 RepID=UPI0025AD13D4|nr:alkylated DNA repair protein ALKBH8 homolog isoform X4 [Cryptomeria japonica]